MHRELLAKAKSLGFSDRQIAHLTGTSHKTNAMYLQDLTNYKYLNYEPEPSVLAVGWLDQDHEFPRGSVPEGFLERILALCFKPVNQTRGFHQSPFLRSASFGYPVEYDGRKMLLGSAEIRVPGRSGKTYAAPNLIYHYIKDCGYLPPQEFLEALMSNQ
jgi:hypothetical protein